MYVHVITGHKINTCYTQCYCLKDCVYFILLKPWWVGFGFDY